MADGVLGIPSWRVGRRVRLETVLYLLRLSCMPAAGLPSNLCFFCLSLSFLSSCSRSIWIISFCLIFLVRASSAFQQIPLIFYSNTYIRIDFSSNFSKPYYQNHQHDSSETYPPPPPLHSPFSSSPHQMSTLFLDLQFGFSQPDHFQFILHPALVFISLSHPCVRTYVRTNQHLRINLSAFKHHDYDHLASFSPPSVLLVVLLLL